jgi:hypothetical protein
MATKPSIRRAQVIHPYGPGAILDWGQECFVVLDTSARVAGWKNAPRIELPRLQKVLGASDGFRLPPALGSSGFKRKVRLSVQRFPSWLFCPTCRKMSRWGREQEIESDGRLPKCSACSRKDREVVLVPMRYLAACRSGHLTDIDWHRWAHAGRSSPRGACDPRTAPLYFDSRSDRGATLEALAIRCGSCKSRQNLRQLLVEGSLRGIGQRCYGRQPWQPRDQEVTCDNPLHVLQRSSTAVHFAKVESALDIRAPEGDGDPRAEAIEWTVQKFIDLGIEHEDMIHMSTKVAKKATETLLTAYPLAEPIRAPEVESWLKIADRPEDVQSLGDPVSEDEGARASALLLDEWPVLTSTTVERDRKAPIIVREEMFGSDDKPSVLGDLFDGVFLVERLREVRVFVGFSRVKTDGELVHPHLGAKHPSWYPAIEVFGEGIFLQFSEDAMRRWETAQRVALEQRMEVFAATMNDDDPFLKRFAARAPVVGRFVLVHTFAHMMIRQLCYECGYSSASLRERLYVFPDRAGVLIYTADGDSEGSLGGLVRQGRSDRLEKTVFAALERAAWCSNDPICSEMPPHGPGKSNRAACHACVLESETSCSEMNALLDRELVIGEGAEGVSDLEGFFRSVLNKSRALGGRV